jgi:predicted AAA+ superfamily ATPase
MVFVLGPRQVGKTWLAKEIAKSFQKTLYLNYDNTKHREIIKEQAWLPDLDLLIFDEIHKMPDWKNYLKGVFDVKPDTMRILITGSARLDAYRQVGDSLAGRFFRHRLLPLSMSELEQTEYSGDFDRLFERGGFLEPFLADSNTDAERWRDTYGDSLLRKDVLHFADVDNYLAMSQVFGVLKSKIGSPISYSSIARDVGISPITAKRYIGIFEALYMVFQVKPHATKIARAILKEPKFYFYDYGLISDPGARLENMIALGLHKNLALQHDTTGKRKTLTFLKTKDGKEIDFAIIGSDHQIENIIEVKTSDKNVSKALRYFSDKYQLRALQIVKNLQIERKDGALIEVRRASDWLRTL